ncbi:SAM-dependent methyltransferase [Teredinibacter franksiae]|uniref:SAM-dependent methyltransferase n=1 Tax=Teredinibacter franksiae TaxID=2761453 RepID=UPI001C8A4886|nr:cyclopropane-fatty-acyl-phospholipid synthase family protein [Teredinibacter franksiae]
MENIREQKPIRFPSLKEFQQPARKLVMMACEKVRVGHLVIHEGKSSYSFGEPADKASVHATIHVHDSSAYSAFLANGTIGSAEAFMNREWTSPDLLSVIRLMVLNLEWLQKMNQGRSLPLKALLKFNQLISANTRSGSKKNIGAHYDLGNDFFKLFLDESMMYSSALYAHPSQSLEEAAVNKLEAICQKLELTASDHLLEIGTGWGGMAIYAAQHYGCTVTTTTISKEQHAYALERVKSLGLGNKIKVVLQDYRDLSGSFDKIVSIEMIEAVGHQYYSAYFKQCSALLNDNGLMLIQAITIPDNRYESARKSTDFIKKMIFPGGCLPSNAVLARHIARDTDMQMVALEDITQHYAQTLADWCARFHNNLAEIKAQGYSDSFCRMWDFYLRYCEGGFRERVIGTVQLLLAKPSYRP